MSTVIQRAFLLRISTTVGFMGASGKVVRSVVGVGEGGNPS